MMNAGENVRKILDFDEQMSSDGKSILPLHFFLCQTAPSLKKGHPAPILNVSSFNLNFQFLWCSTGLELLPKPLCFTLTLRALVCLQTSRKGKAEEKKKKGNLTYFSSDVQQGRQIKQEWLPKDTGGYRLSRRKPRQYCFTRE